MRRMIFLLLILLTACFNPENHSNPDSQNVSLQFMKPASIDVSSAFCRVTADDMDTMEVDLMISPTMISGQIAQVPYGENRLFEIFCYDSEQLLNYYGTTLANINNAAPVINITLYPQQHYADVTIIGNFSTGEAETAEKIVFAADYSGTYDIYIMDIDGTNIRQLTATSYQDGFPQLSPDRKKVSFQRNTGSGSLGYVLDLETNQLDLLPLSEYSPNCMGWHPDGNSLVFHSTYYGTSDIFNYNLNTDILTVLIRNDTTKWVPVYSEDGTYLLYYTKVNQQFRAYIADADGSNPVLLNPNGHPDERLPHMNPVNNNLVLFSGRYYSDTYMIQFGLYITDRSSGVVSEVVAQSGINESFPDWSPDGNTIIYERWDGDSYGIYTVNPDGSANTTLLDSGENERYPHWR